MVRPKPDVYCGIEGCKNGARWRVAALDESDDQRYACNSHLGKVCEQIVQTTKVKYDIIYLARVKAKPRRRRKDASVKVVEAPVAPDVVEPAKPRRTRKTRTRKKKGSAKPRTRKKRW